MEQQGGVEDVRTLIAYYSRRGENLVDGTVQNLQAGNTELLAAILQKLTGADCFRIEPVEDYSENYYRCIDQARQDLQRKYRPMLRQYPDHFEDYDVIYLGYPNYWGTMPMPVYSFLEQLDFAGKLIKPFCTHEGGGMGRSEQDIRMICPKARITDGLPIRGSEMKYELFAIEDWVYDSEKTIYAHQNL